MNVGKLRRILANCDDNMEVMIDTVDGFKPIHDWSFNQLEQFTGLDFNYCPIETVYDVLVLDLGHYVFQKGTISDRELYEKGYRDRKDLIYEISGFIRDGLTDNGARKLSQKTVDKWNKILYDMQWNLPVIRNKSIRRFSVDSNGCLHFYEEW